MAEKINLRSSKVKEHKRRVGEYGTETPLSSTAVERGTTRWLNGSTVFIEGLLDVTGTTTISGALTVSGATSLSGVLTIAGPTGITGTLTIQGATTISGKLDVTGPTTLAGTLDITGDTKLTGNMDVTGGGRIKIGTNMTLTPATDGGAISFQGGAKLSSVGGTVSISGQGSVSSIVAGLTSAGMSAGSSHLALFNDGTWELGSSLGTLAPAAGGNLNAAFTQVNLSGKLAVTNAATFANNVDVTGRTRLLGNVVMSGLPTTGSTANLHVQADGFVYKSTSASRFKLDQQPILLPQSLLDVEVKDWLDIGQVERDEAKYRIPGVIAEEVLAAGGKQFVTFDAEEVVEGVMYDRLAIARTALLYERIRAIEALIGIRKEG